MYRFEEIQGAPLWLYCTTVSAVAGIVPLILVIPNPVLQACAYGLLFALGLLLMDLCRMRTRVDQHNFKVRWGLLTPAWMPMHIALEDIREIKVVVFDKSKTTYVNGLWSEGYEGKPCRYYHMRGDEGVLIETAEGKRLIIGSQRPEELAAALLEG